MKTIILTIFAVPFLLTTASSQVSFGLVAGKSPVINPSTSHIFVNRDDPKNEFSFNAGNTNYSSQIGFCLRKDVEPFWFMLEAYYGKSESEYHLKYTRINGPEKNMTLEERNSYLSLPISIGFKRGLFEVFSGFTVTRELNRETELTRIKGYSSSVPSTHLSWHSGLGMHYKFVFVNLRYQLSFRNYGADRYVNGKELSLYNIQGRPMLSFGIGF